MNSKKSESVGEGFVLNFEVNLQCNWLKHVAGTSHYHKTHWKMNSNSGLQMDDSIHFGYMHTNLIGITRRAQQPVNSIRGAGFTHNSNKIAGS